MCALPRLVFALGGLACACAAKKKSKARPALPPELGPLCPFHRAEAEPHELSEFGHELERDGRQPEAMHCYARAIRSAPRTAIGWFDIAAAFQHTDPSRALRYYRQGLSLEPTGFHYSQLGVLLRTRDRHEEAVGCFRAASALLPNDANAPFHLGGSYDLLGRYHESLHAYRKALGVERNNEARIQNNIGNVLGKLTRWPDALRAFAEAEEADPTFPETHSNLAHVFTSLGRLEEAERHVKEARRLLPSSADVLEREATWREALENRTKARKRDKWYDELDKRDGHLSKDERIQRFQQVVGQCGGMENKACIRTALGQDDGDPDIPIRF